MSDPNLDTIKRKLQALLSMTTAAGCTEAEAQAAAAKAAELMRRHGLTEADLVMAREGVPCTTRPTVVDDLWHMLAWLTGCAMVRDLPAGLMQYIGRQPGPTVATYLHVFLHRHIEAAVAAYKASPEYKRKRTIATRRRACEAFRAGMVDRFQVALVRHFGRPDPLLLEAAKEYKLQLYGGSLVADGTREASSRHASARAAGHAAAAGVTLRHGVDGAPVALIGAD